MAAANVLGAWAPPLPLVGAGGGKVCRRTSLSTTFNPSALSVRPSLCISTRLEKPRIVACSIGRNLEEESFVPNGNSSSSKEASFDIKLPRRNLMVQFTCNACGERTQRTVNRVAYERGTVFVQCAGCLVHHKLVDNLGLVVEYDLRKKKDEDNGENELV